MGQNATDRGGEKGQDLGMMLHPGLAVGFAWRRCSPGRHQLLPAIRPVSPEAMEMPMQAWPSSWEGLVEHVRQGGVLPRRRALALGDGPRAAGSSGPDGLRR